MSLNLTLFAQLLALLLFVGLPLAAAAATMLLVRRRRDRDE
jgi:hypothetical protein